MAGRRRAMREVLLDRAYQELERKYRSMDRGNSIGGHSLCDALHSAYLELKELIGTDPPVFPTDLAGVMAMLVARTQTKLSSAYRNVLRANKSIERNKVVIEPQSPYVPADRSLMAAQSIALLLAELDDDQPARDLVLLNVVERVDYKDNKQIAVLLGCSVPEVTNIKKRIANAARRSL